MKNRKNKRVLLFEHIFEITNKTPYLKIGVKFNGVKPSLNNLCKIFFNSFKGPN